MKNYLIECVKIIPKVINLYSLSVFWVIKLISFGSNSIPEYITAGCLAIIPLVIPDRQIVAITNTKLEKEVEELKSKVSAMSLKLGFMK